MSDNENIFAKEDQERQRKRLEHAIKWGIDDLDVTGQIEVREMAQKVIYDNNISNEAEMQKIYIDTKRQYLEYKKQRGSAIERAYAILDKNSPEAGKRMRSFHAQTLWEKTLKRLQEEISPAIFQTWFKDTTGISYQNDVLTVRVSSPFAQTQIQTRFIEQIRSILLEIDKAVLDVRFELNISEPNIENNDTSSPAIEDITQHPDYIKGYQRCIEYGKEQEEQQKSPYQQGWNAAFKESVENKVSAAIAAESTEEQQGQSNTSLLNDLPEDNVIKKLQEEIKQLDERLKRLERYTEE